MIRFQCVLLLISTFLFGNKVSGCPDGWMSHHSACYLFSHDIQSWWGAMSMCREWEGQLVEVDDSAEHAFLLSQTKLRDKNFWIALSDIEQYRTWVWMPSQQKLTNVSYSNWHKGQPNYHLPDKNCVAMDYTSHYTWFNFACMSNFYYICELPEYNGGQIVGK